MVSQLIEKLDKDLENLNNSIQPLDDVFMDIEQKSVLVDIGESTGQMGAGTDAQVALHQSKSVIAKIPSIVMSIEQKQKKIAQDLSVSLKYVNNEAKKRLAEVKAQERADEFARLKEESDRRRDELVRMRAESAQRIAEIRARYTPKQVVPVKRNWWE